MVFLLSADKKFFPGLLCAIASIIVNHADQKIKFYIIPEDLEKSHFKRLSNFVEKKYQQELLILQLDKKDFDLSSFRSVQIENGGAFLQWGNSTAAYNRLWIASLVLEDKVFYIDSDLLINKNLGSLWQMDISEYVVCACENFNVKKLGEDIQPHSKALTNYSILEKRYFNSGFMLLNLKKWREMNLEEKIIEIISDPENLISMHNDQSILNFLLHNHVLFLDQSYNLSQFELVANEKEVITNIHYVGGKKPWIKYYRSTNSSLWKNFYSSYVSHVPEYAFTTGYIYSYISFWYSFFRGRVGKLYHGK